MGMKRASCQKNLGSFDRFYRRFDQGQGDPATWKVGEKMAVLIDALDSVCEGKAVWGLTSHERLVLLSADEYASPWYVLIQPQPWGAFEIEYLLPPQEAPWPGATVKGTSTDVFDAVHKIQIGMKASGGWLMD